MNDHGSNPMRGVVYGVLFSIPLWAALYALARLVMH